MTTIEIIVIIGMLLLVVGSTILFFTKYFHKVEMSYTTKYGTLITLSPKTKTIKKDLIEDWTDSVVHFWNTIKEWDKEECYRIFGEMEIEMYDEQYLVRAGMNVNGITWPDFCLIEIATLPKNSDKMSIKRVESLFIHETSHLILEYVGKIIAGDDSEIHHKIFEEVGLGA